MLPLTLITRWGQHRLPGGPQPSAGTFAQLLKLAETKTKDLR